MKRLALLTYCSSTGLAYQGLSYYKHLHPSKTMLVDLSQYNHMPLNPEWYPDAWRMVHGFPTDQDCDEFLQDVDVLLVAETPLNYYLFKRAKELGIRTCLVFNYEFLDYLLPNAYRTDHFVIPDILAAPSTWHIDQVRRLPGAHVEELPLPVDLDELPQRELSHARHFFHIAGRPAIHDRAGTLDFIAAVKLAHHLMPEATFTLYLQQPTPEIRAAMDQAPMINRVWNVPNVADLYAEGEVMVMPRRYGGQSLPVNEAIGCGIPVLMTDCPPNSDWLPKDWLIPVKPNPQKFMTRTMIDIYSVQTQALAQRLLDLYRDDSRVQAMHEQAKEIAQRRSWEALKPRYEEVLGL
jgi:glycosyltransferase involved in cell wall biosynthesis